MPRTVEDSRRAEGPSGGASPSLRRELLVSWIHLAVLWSLAIAQPLFDVLADSPDFFVARGNTRADILVFAFGLTLIPPTILFGIELLFLRSARIRRVVHVVLIGALCAALALQVMEGAVTTSTALLFVIAVLLGALAAYLYARKEAVRSVLTVLGAAPVLFLALFLLFSPVSKLVLPQAEDSSAAADVAGDTPVVVVVFDEFAGTGLMNSRLQIDASRYPHFAQLARGSTWYRNATTVSNSTTYAVPAIASGRVPEKGDLPIASDYPTNVFTVLGKDYRLSVNEPATELCPDRLCGETDRGSSRSRLRALFDDLSVVSAHLLLPPSLDERLPAVDRTFGGFRDSAATTTGNGNDADADVPAAAFHDRHGQWQRTVRAGTVDSSRPNLTFVHVLLPHFPWQHLPSGQQYATAGPDLPGTEDEVWGQEPALAEQGYQRFLLQAGYADWLIGDLTDRLRAKGLYDRSLLVITADHGVSFHAGQPRRKITEDTYADIAPVPLFIKLPGQRSGRVDDRMARSVDVLPTIADELGIRLDGDVDGRSLLKPAGPALPVAVALGGSDPVSHPFDEFKRLRDAAVQRQVQMFGDDDGFSGLFAPSSSGGLIGSEVAQFQTTGGPATVALDSPMFYADVNPEAPLVPAFVTGRLAGSASPGQTYAIAINGRIRATTSSYTAPDGLRLGAMVDPSAFREGSNRVEVYGTVRAGETTRLVRVRRTDTVVAARLTEREGREAIVRSGRATPINPGDMAGFVETLVTDAGVVRTTGWAVDAERKRPVDEILVFAGDELVAAAKPSLAREDIAEEYGSGLLQAGFEVSGPFPGSQDEEVRIFAVSGDRASEIKPGETTIR